MSTNTRKRVPATCVCRRYYAFLSAEMQIRRNPAESLVLFSRDQHVNVGKIRRGTSISWPWNLSGSWVRDRCTTFKKHFHKKLRLECPRKLEKCGPQETFISRSWIPHEAECNPALDSVFDGIGNWASNRALAWSSSAGTYCTLLCVRGWCTSLMASTAGHCYFPLSLAGFLASLL